jgi:two-component system, chemotaxis family, sensor kinase Cph1
MSRQSHITQTDLERCEDEQIHVPGYIQSHGLLYAFDAQDLTIRYVSDNTGQPAIELLGQPVSAVLDPEEVQQFKAIIDTPTTIQLEPLHITRTVDSELVAFNGVIHRNDDGLILLELEPDTLDTSSSFLQAQREATGMMSKLQSIDDLPMLMDVVAELVHAFSGYDRVMVYRFDKQWNGHVASEVRTPNAVESYEGLHYPASDIPAQARQLYTTNWLRMIADVAYEPVPIVGDSDHALDLSRSQLRSVSPIHTEYLHNMGVAATMTVSIVVDDELWGMIACHHYAPKFVPYEIRAGLMLFAELLSWRLALLQHKYHETRLVTIEAMTANLVEKMLDTDDPIQAIKQGPVKFTDLFEVGGGAIYIGETWHTCGETPDTALLDELVTWLWTNDHEGIFATNHLSGETPVGAQMTALASGLIALPLPYFDKAYILWFRPEEVHTVTWGGEPQKALQRDAEGRLHPRQSFAAWKEVVRAKSVDWEDWELDAAQYFATRLRQVMNNLALTEQMMALDFERKRIRILQEFIGNISHDLRTPLSILSTGLYLLKKDQVTHSRLQRIQSLESQIIYLRQMVDDMLTTTRLEGEPEFQFERVEMNRLLQDMSLETLGYEGRMQTTIKLTLADAPIHAVVNPSYLRRAISNLVENAIHYSPDGALVQVSLKRQQDELLIRVVDNGRGIAPGDLSRIFERFYRSNDARKYRNAGSGLGLSIVQQIVNAHQGEITVESQLGQGSTFSISLPLSPFSANH